MTDKNEVKAVHKRAAFFVSRGTLRSLIIFIPIIASLIGIVYFMFYSPFNDGSGKRDPNLFSQYGTFIYGLFGTLLTLLNSLLIYFTFKEQQTQFTTLRSEHAQESADQENEKQTDRNNQLDFFRKERFENRLFEMMKANREIVYQMEYEVPDEFTPAPNDPNFPNANKHNIILVRGQKVLVQIHKHIGQALQECSWVFQEYQQFDDFFLNTQIAKNEREILQKYYEQKADEALLIKVHKFNIVYLCVFFGLGEDGIKMLTEILSSRYKADLIRRIITTLKLKPAKWEEFWATYKEIKNKGFQEIKDGNNIYDNKKYVKYYGGHQHRLGHYFRHLFAIFNFINTQDFLNFKAKYSYAKFLRSQFSAYEQSVFFYNSLSTLGRIWEIEADKNDKVADIIDKRLITKYNLVKNILAEFIGDVDLEEVYPLVEFEIGKKIPEKEQLKMQYDKGTYHPTSSPATIHE